MDVVIVSNVGTSAAIARAIKTGMPLVERVVTVTGSGVAEPKNLMVRIGTSFMDVIQACGGFVEEPAKVISRAHDGDWTIYIGRSGDKGHFRDSGFNPGRS